MARRGRPLKEELFTMLRNIVADGNLMIGNLSLTERRALKKLAKKGYLTVVVDGNETYAYPTDKGKAEVVQVDERLHGRAFKASLIPF